MEILSLSVFSIRPKDRAVVGYYRKNGKCVVKLFYIDTYEVTGDEFKFYSSKTTDFIIWGDLDNIDLEWIEKEKIINTNFKKFAYIDKRKKYENFPPMIIDGFVKGEQLDATYNNILERLKSTGSKRVGFIL